MLMSQSTTSEPFSTLQIKSNLRILTMNCRSVLNKTAELAAAIEYIKPDVIYGTALVNEYQTREIP